MEGRKEILSTAQTSGLGSTTAPPLHWRLELTQGVKGKGSKGPRIGCRSQAERPYLGGEGHNFHPTSQVRSDPPTGPPPKGQGQLSVEGGQNVCRGVLWRPGQGQASGLEKFFHSPDITALPLAGLWKLGAAVTFSGFTSARKPP